jgi:tetratricopeptide (TPR) repeat protein
LLCRLFFDEIEEYHEAIAELDARLREAAGDFVALNNRGLMHWEIGQPEQAREDLERACALANSDALPHENLGRVLKQHGQREMAIASYKRALAISPDIETALAGLTALASET